MPHPAVLLEFRPSHKSKFHFFRITGKYPDYHYQKITFKEKIYDHCLEALTIKINTHRATLDDLKKSASNETKSTAGDKHETALAMLQIEQKNTAAQMEHLLAQKLVITRLLPVIHEGQVKNGSLVKTSKGYFYVIIPLGKLTVDGINVTTLSAKSPLGSRLMGSTVGDLLTVSGITYLIESID